MFKFIFKSTFKFSQAYSEIYIHVSLGGHNLGTFYARKLKTGMLLSKT